MRDEVVEVVEKGGRRLITVKTNKQQELQLMHKRYPKIAHITNDRLDTPNSRLFQFNKGSKSIKSSHSVVKSNAT